MGQRGERAEGRRADAAMAHGERLQDRRRDGRRQAYRCHEGAHEGAGHGEGQAMTDLTDEEIAEKAAAYVEMLEEAWAFYHDHPTAFSPHKARFIALRE